MTDNEQIKAIAELDGWVGVQFNSAEGRIVLSEGMIGMCDGGKHEQYERCKPYLTSRDAIVPVIEKIITADKEVNHLFPYKLYDLLPRKVADENSYTSVMAVLATPRQLCESLLRSTGKWKD